MEDDNFEEQAELLELETLLVGGTDTTVPIVVNYLGKDFSAYIRPINGLENNEIVQKYTKKKESIPLNTVKIALMKKDGSSYTIDELKKIPTGVIDKLYEKIAEISGIETSNSSKDQEELMRELIGF